MGQHLLQSGDPILLNLCRDRLNLLGVQTYVRGRFQEELAKNFTYQEQSVIQEKREQRTSAIYAILQCFRYESNLSSLMESLKDALQSIKRMTSSSQSVLQSVPEIHLPVQVQDRNQQVERLYNTQVQSDLYDIYHSLVGGIPPNRVSILNQRMKGHDIELFQSIRNYSSFQSTKEA